MMSLTWVVLFLALAGSQCGYGLPVRPTPQDYPLDGSSTLQGWGVEGGLYAVVPVLALVVTAVVLLFGCTWCYRHNDCKPDEGTDNQLFTASAQHLHTAARVQPPDSGFSEPANNNISEDNNNGPISLREMQNIANNNAAAYIVSENEERNRISRESVVEFEPLPTGIIGGDPLERCADWFGGEDFPRNNLQYLREIGRGWFGRVVEGEIEEAGASTTVAVKILNQNATLEDKARFLDEAKMYRDVTHENILAFIGTCLQEDPWIILFELCSVDLQQYLIVNRPKMAILNENGVPLQLMCDISSALAYLHSRGYTYGQVCGGSVLVREPEGAARAVLGRYSDAEPRHECVAPEVRQGAPYTISSEIWSLGSLIWEVCSWGAAPTGRPSPPPELPCPYKSHLYQVMQLCWAGEARARPSAAQVHALLAHLHGTQGAARAQPHDHAHFEERWQRLKPNSIPKIDEHVAIVHAPSAARFTLDESEHPAPVSRSSSIMSERDALASNVKSASLTNLHGSLDDVGNIYLTHNETAALECHQGNVHLDDTREKEQDRSDASVDPWLKDIIAGSQDDVSYYRDVSDVIKNLDNILNSEKTSSSESSHQASPSRDNLSLDCKKEVPLQSSLVKSPGITNFQNILDTGFAAKDGETFVEEEVDRDTIGTLSHSFERHSDSTSQHTLENLTPDTPMRDMEVFIDVERLATEAEVSEIESQMKSDEVEKETETIVYVTETETVESAEIDNETPKEVTESNVPELKGLCVASMSSVGDLRSPSKDCQTPCDIVTEIRTEDETKSIDEVRETATDSMPLEVIEVTDSVENHEQVGSSEPGVILPVSIDESTIHEGVDTLPSVTEDVSTTQENDTSLVRLEDIGPESMESENNYSKDETILVSDLVDTVTDSSKDEQREAIKIDVEVDLEPIPPEETPVSVQNIIQDAPCQETDLKQLKKADSAIVKLLAIAPTHLPPDIVQNTDRDGTVHETENLVLKQVVEEEIEKLENKDSEANISPRSDSLVVNIQERADDSSQYKDLINNTNSEIIKHSTIDNSVIKIEAKENSSVETIPAEDSALSKNDSTQYLDLPSFNMIKKTRDFLQMEMMLAGNSADGKLVASTPIGSDKSGDILDSFEVANEDETMIMSKTKMPLCETGNLSEQKCVADNVSPFESPSHRSHQTDTYDENSSVVLGPFENCNTEMIKGAKPNIDPVELPREELLAFSSHFSEMNLETPSPLRDGNFLNEVPDITPDGVFYNICDDAASTSERKEAPSDASESGSGTQKHVSPSTPPNSPGVSLASTSQEKYLVDIDLSGEAVEPDSIRSIDLNQIELQITSKLAMAENENNLNIEYSGPLTVEGLIEEGGAMRESDAVPEMYLAGNGGSLEDLRDLHSLNEESVQALRNELELKLPLAQVASIEPAAEGAAEWGEELPPPPELVVSYMAALSPIQEETRSQLSAYENDTHWNPAGRTESSESYPEPCNNSTDSATSLPRGDTYTVPSRELQPTHTLHSAPPDDPHPSSREVTMSVDSLNGSPYKSHTEPDPLSPIDDRTYSVADERDTNCERISQVSPCLVSPTTDTGTGDNATRVSTLSRTTPTVPTDANLSKPSDTQCLSKATSIDSWCSNDTLYNVEENFDELAMDGDLPAPADDEGKSESTDTLTHNEDREASPCETYLIHDTNSEPCDTFSPDSITANHDDTHTKVKPEATITPSANTDPEDSKNTQTKDLAYGTLLSGMPSYSNCSLEVASEDGWRLQPPELVRRSPLGSCEISPPRREEQGKCENNPTPPLSERRLSKMDSVEITCLGDHSAETTNAFETENRITITDDSPKCNNMAKTSTPLVEPSADTSHIEGSPLILPEINGENSQSSINEAFVNTFQESDELRAQDLDSKVATSQKSQVLLESLNEPPLQNRSNLVPSECSLNYFEFENSVACKPQGKIELEQTPIYSNFENSADFTPQDKTKYEDNPAPRDSNKSSRGKPQDKVESERSSTYSDFGSSAACKPQDKAEPERSSTYSDFENSVACKPQEKADPERCSTYSDFENSAACKPQDKFQQEQSSTYSDFENSAACKPQEKSEPERGSTYSDFENSAACKPQEKAEPERSSTYSDFENSAACKPQDKVQQEQSSTYSDFENSAACKPQEKAEPERCSTYSDFENSASCKPQDKVQQEQSSTYSDFENSVACKPQDKMESATPKHQDISESKRSSTYSDFENSATCKPQDKAEQEQSATYSDFENSAAYKPQDTVEEEQSSTYSDFENSVACKPLSKTVSESINTYSNLENSAVCELNNKLADNGITYSEPENSFAYSFQNKAESNQISTSSDLENSTERKPQENRVSERSEIQISKSDNSDGCKHRDDTVSQRSTTYSDFETTIYCNNQVTAGSSSINSELQNATAYKSQDKICSEKSSQSMEIGISTEEFRSFENCVKYCPQDLSSLIDASSMLLNSERMFGELLMNSPSDIQNQNCQSNASEETVQPVITPPSLAYLIESPKLSDTRDPSSAFLINFDMEDETEQPHSIIVTEVPMSLARVSPNRTYDLHAETNLMDTFNSNAGKSKVVKEPQQYFDLPKLNGESHEQPESLLLIEPISPEIENQSTSNHSSANAYGEIEKLQSNDIIDDMSPSQSRKNLSNGSVEVPKSETLQNVSKEIHVNGGCQKFATVNFINETFEELVESSVDDSVSKDEDKLVIDESLVAEVPSDLEDKVLSPVKDKSQDSPKDKPQASSKNNRSETHLLSTTESHEEQVTPNGMSEPESKITAVTEDFLQNEKKYATSGSYFPMLSDIRFSGPADEMMSTSFQDSPTSPNSPECEQDSKPNIVSEIMKEWDSDSESHSSNSSSGEFIWKDGAGLETSLVPSTHFDHQRGGAGGEGRGGGGASSGSGESGSGSEGDEVEFVPSSWDCRAAPAKSSLRTLEQATPESKKRVVFKRQKYHCVYEYPREAPDAQPHSPAYLPDLSTYCEWDPRSAEEAELCYGQLFSSPSALGVHYPLRAGAGPPFGPDYEEDFFISSSARPFESLGIMSTTSQFFPGGMHGKRALLERSLSDEGVGFPAPCPAPRPAPAPPAAATLAPDLDFTTPDSGVEDITPGSTLELRFEPKPEPPAEGVWRPLDSGSSSESVSPSSPAAELGGLRHTRDRLKLDLPPSPAPHAPSPRHARVFSFALAAPRRRDAPLVMTDDTPVAGAALPPPEEHDPPPEPTFSTFGKSAPRLDPDQKMILTEEVTEPDTTPPEPAAKGEGTVLDSGDEDSGIESSSKATLERNTHVS